MSAQTMREQFEAWECEQYKTRHTALWECWQKTGGDVAKVEALKDKIEKREEGQQPVGYLDRIPSGDYGFRSIKVSPHAYYKIPVYTRSDADVIREMNDEMADLRARLAERDALLQMFIDNSEDPDVVEISRHALSARAEPSAPKCNSCNGSGWMDSLRAVGSPAPDCKACCGSGRIEPSAPVERDERADFEAWHASVWPEGGIMVGRWMAWQARAALRIKP